MSGDIIRVDRDRCVGAAQCVLVAPSAFGQDDEGLAVVLDQSIVDEALEAEDLCPARAITVTS